MTIRHLHLFPFVDGVPNLAAHGDYALCSKHPDDLHLNPIFDQVSICRNEWVPSGAHMASLPGAENRSGHVMARDLKWSDTEKGIACKAFERALEREFEAVIRTAKEMAGKIEQPADLWGLEFYLAILRAHSSLRVRRNGSFSRPRTPRVFCS